MGKDLDMHNQKCHKHNFLKKIDTQKYGLIIQHGIIWQPVFHDFCIDEDQKGAKHRTS